MASKEPRQCTFFIVGDGIDREVITTDISRYVGNDALIKPRTHKFNGREIQGYYLTAYRSLTSGQLDELRRDSARWREERRRNKNSRNPSRLSLPFITNIARMPNNASAYPGTLNRTGFNPSYTAPSPYDFGIAPDPQEIDYSKPSVTSQMDYAIEPASTPPTYSYPQQITQRSAPIRSQSEPARPVGGNIRDIKLFHPVTGQSRNAGVLLDTGCVTDNWISGQTVSKLGADNLINYSAPMKTMQAADMGPVKSKGIIELDFRWLPKGVKVHTTSFNVADASHYDIIIGNEYIDENHLHKWDEDAFSPLIEHDPAISPNESEDMRQARLRQEQEKVDREEARARARDNENAKRNGKTKERYSRR